MLDLFAPISSLKGIGPKKLKSFSKIGIYTIIDLLYYFPNNYENRKNIKSLNDVKNDEKATIVARIWGEIEEFNSNKKLKILKVPIRDKTNRGYMIFFNAPYLKNIFKKNDIIYIYGKINIVNGVIQISHPEFINSNNSSLKEFAEIKPIYRLTKGLSQKDFTNSLRKVLIDSKVNLQEYLPTLVLNKNSICDINFALKNIHFPSSVRALQVARYRLIFEEFLFLQFGLFLIKKNLIESSQGISFKLHSQLNELIKKLPFQLTPAQRRVLDDVINDMTQGKIMNRLIQGDVGSGKTIIALLAMYLASLNGYQSALMAPTEILAEQHYESFTKTLTNSNIKVGLLTRNIKNKESILDKIKSGAIDIIIGTHAIIQDKIEFDNLGLVVTDEQHRFGVRQRKFLQEKGNNADIIVMSATPIPRTLSLVLYGDLDISVIDEMPPGRKYIKTYKIEPNKTDKLYNFIKEEVKKGRQAYIVCPLVDDSDKIEAQSATELYNELKNSHFKENKLGLIHGKMNIKDKEAVMKDFYNENVEILISTTVIEVGINVPNATIMIVQNAERFGLAQLHQLRGRVGRGENQSYCFLVDYKDSKISPQRMKIMENTNDGFLVAEKDLELRGPGDFFGTKQHGLPELKIANIFKHGSILKNAQTEAQNILDNIHNLSIKEKELFINKIRQGFNNVIDDFTI